MKQTILTDKQSSLLEDLIVSHGHIVSSEQIYKAAEGIWNYQQTKKTIVSLAKNGWLIRIKRGLYAISDLSNRGFLSLSPYVVANLLVKDSYVSFESSLNYHGLFDQLTNKVISISKVQYKSVELNSTEYSFVNVQDKWFFGWEAVNIDDEDVHIATAEKALIDMIQFHRSKYSVDLLIEKLRDNKDSLNIDRLEQYLRRMSITTTKTFGLVFDLLGINTANLYQLVNGKRGTDWMISGDKTFNAKWRLYYDAYFDKYQIHP